MPWWEIVLTVLGGILLLLLLLLLIPAKITVKYSEKLQVYLYVLFLRFSLYPKKKNKLNPDDYKIEKLRKKKLHDEKKAAKKRAKSVQKTKKDSGVTFSDLPSLLDVIKDISGTLLKTFFGHLKIKVSKMIIRVATDDAAKTAITFGAVSSAVATLLELLGNATKLEYSNKSEIDVCADYLSENFTAEIDISFAMKVWQVLHVLLKTAFRYLKNRSNQNL